MHKNPTSQEVWDAKKSKYPFHVYTTWGQSPHPSEVPVKIYGDFLRVAIISKYVAWGFLTQEAADRFRKLFRRTLYVQKR